jgi:multicomponent Na+:H+ antiporter subunit E
MRTKGEQLRIIAALKRFLLLAVIWLALTGGDRDGLVVGGIVSALSVWLSLRLLPPAPRGVSLAGLVRLLPTFIWRSVLGGVDVARRALHPHMRLKPGWVILPTMLPEGGARVALGGEFSLLPGTLVAGSRGDELLIHCLDTDQEIGNAVRREEKEIAATMGLRLGRATSAGEGQP